MSNPNPPNPNPDQIQQAIDATKQTQGVPLEVKLDTGQVYRGQTPQDVLYQLVAAQTEATRTITAERAERARLADEIAQLRSQIQPPKPDASEEDKQKYFAQWAQDPDRAFDEQLAKRLKTTPDKVGEVLNRVVTETVASSAADEFMSRYPQFPNTPQNAQLINKRLRERFGQDITATSADNIELVFSELVRTGQMQLEPMQVSGMNHPYTAVANIRGQQALPNPQNAILQDFATLPLEKQKETLDRLFAQGLR